MILVPHQTVLLVSLESLMPLVKQSDVWHLSAPSEAFFCVMSHPYLFYAASLSSR